ncbi:hypothetical protein ACSTDE_14340 [Enterobacter hormaechei]|uniref:hypothetical protein n=1 Tax=Enterobacter hormaechei TaxID=158836 RepID=UPI003D73B4CD
MITEKNNVFYCDCGFFFERGRSGAHNCETGLRKKLAESEAKLSALAAENAGLKAVCEDRRTFIMNGVQLGYIQVPTVETDPALETIRVAVSPQEPTPATDAFLAEVRAQGVDVAIEHLINKFEGTGRICVPVMALEWLAQELRKGARS